MKKRALCLICAVSMILSCICFPAFAITSNCTESKIAKTKGKIALELDNNKFNVNKFKEDNPDIKDIESVESKVVFDYTNDKDVLERSLTEPVDVYEQETIVIYTTNEEENIRSSVGLESDDTSSLSVKTANIQKKLTRVYNGSSITFTNRSVCNIIQDYYDEYNDKTFDIYYQKSAQIISSSVDDSAWVQKLDLNLTTFGTSYYPTEDPTYRISKNKSYTFTQNSGISKSISNSTVGYVNIETGSPSCVGCSADMYIIWKTGPWATDGKSYCFSYSEGAGNPY